MEEIRQIDKHSAPIYEGMRMLYSMARDQLLKQELPLFVDVNHEFGSLSSTEEIFVDHAHLNPAGDMHVASIYRRVLMERVLPSME